MGIEPKTSRVYATTYLILLFFSFQAQNTKAEVGKCIQAPVKFYMALDSLSRHDVRRVGWFQSF